MAVTIENGSFVGKDQEGNIVRVRGWTDNDEIGRASCRERV